MQDNNEFKQYHDDDDNIGNSSGVGWYVGIIVALALCAIAFLVFSANAADYRVKDLSDACVAEVVGTTATVSKSCTRV